jgi:DNA polymerase I-like protein with 3'-5' exonuclease and polymerase domains
LPGAIAACRPRLLSELADCGVETAVTLGNSAVSALLNTKVGITKLRGGSAKESDYGSFAVVPTFHPAACLRNQAQFPLMLSDLAKVNPRDATWIEPDIHVITDADRAVRVLHGANRNWPYVMDVETGKEKEQQYSRTTNLLCVGFGSTRPNHGERVVVIGRPAIYDPRVQDGFINLFADTGVICQNGKFDTYILHGINNLDRDIQLVADTMLQSYSLNENPGTHSLDYMGREYLGCPDWKEVIRPYLKAPKDPPEIRQPSLEYVEEILREGPDLRTEILKWRPEDLPEAAIKRAAAELHVREFKDPNASYKPHQIRWSLDPSASNQVATPEADGSYASIPPDILHKYNAYDVQVTRMLYEYFVARQAQEGLTEFNEHLMVMSNALMRVERNGLQVDYQFNEELFKQFSDHIDSLRAIFPDELNPASVPQLKKFIWQEYGQIMQSTGEDAVVALIDDPKTDETFRQFCKDLLEYRKWTKLRSTYVNSIRKQAIENGGRVLPTFKIDQATTGRLASKNPNVQNMPRQFDIKRQFIPSTRDRVFVHADYSQLELRVITWLAKDETMRALFNDPERDVFDEMTLYVYDMTREAFNDLKLNEPHLAKEMRVVVKSFAYGIAYGRTPHGIAADPDLHLTVDEAVKRHAIFEKQIPAILDFQQDVIRRIHRGEDLVNVFGRHRRFHLITNQNKHDLEKQAMAYLPQSTASDICVTALSRLPKHFDPRNIIHDDILLECHRSEAHEVGQQLKQIMIDTAEEFTDHYVKFDCDYEIGENWSDMVKAEKWTG